MDTVVTISYDSKNISVKNILDSLFKLGLLKKEKTGTTTKKCSKSKGLELTMKAIKEIEDGKGTRCKTFEEYKSSVMK